MTFEEQAAANTAGLTEPRTLRVTLDTYGAIAMMRGNLEMGYGTSQIVEVEIPIKHPHIGIREMRPEPPVGTPADVGHMFIPSPPPIPDGCVVLPNELECRLSGRDLLVKDGKWEAIFLLARVPMRPQYTPPHFHPLDASALYRGKVNMACDLTQHMPIADGEKRARVAMQVFKPEDDEPLFELTGHMLKNVAYMEAFSPETVKRRLDAHIEDDSRHLTEDDRTVLGNVLTTDDVEQTYSATSEKPQSGKAVAEAIAAIDLQSGGGDCNVTINSRDSIVCGTQAVVDATVGGCIAIGYMAEVCENNNNSYTSGMAGTDSTSVAYGSMSLASRRSVAVGGFAEAGNTNPGSWGRNTAIGYNAKAGVNADYATALGYSSMASGYEATALGYSSMASGSSAIAFGYYATASGSSATALGSLSMASGSSATALGSSSTASGSSAIALGSSATALGYSSTAIGTMAQVYSDNVVGISTGERDGIYSQFYFFQDASGAPCVAFAEYDVLSGALTRGVKMNMMTGERDTTWRPAGGDIYGTSPEE